MCSIWRSRLKREVPGRTAAQVAAIIATAEGVAVSERTVQRLFARHGLNTRPDGTPPAAFGRFEAAARNDRWTGDALHGPLIVGRKAYLFAFIDDHSRAVPGHRWGLSEDSVRLEAALRHGLASRGVPKSIYVDNGSSFVAAPLIRACAVLGIRLVHSRPGQPAGRGKIERFFRTVRDQFLVEVAARDVASLVELNRLFSAWVETAYHRRVHTETGQTPLERFLASGPPVLPSPELLHEAFLWSDKRTVTKTATVSLHGNRRRSLSPSRRHRDSRRLTAPHDEQQPGSPRPDHRLTHPVAAVLIQPVGEHAVPEGQIAQLPVTESVPCNPTPESSTSTSTTASSTTTTVDRPGASSSTTGAPATPSTGP